MGIALDSSDDHSRFAEVTLVLTSPQALEPLFRSEDVFLDLAY